MRVAPRLALLLLVLAACKGDDGGATTATTTATTGADTSAGVTSESTSTATGAVTTTTATTGGPASGWSTTLKVGTEHGAFLSVWGPSAEEVYAVGGQVDGGASHGILFAYDGQAWTEVTLPEGTPGLNWISGASGELWTVGYQGAALRREDGLWVSHPTGVTSMLWGVWGSAPGDLWAVGGNGSSEDPLLVHWDGAAWSEVALPALDVASHGLFKVWGSAADDVMIVGDVGVTLRWDGAVWTPEPSGAIIDLISVWGTEKSDILAVGGRANARIARWDGAAWTGQTLSLPGLNGVWVDGAGAATIVGWQGTVATLAPGSFEPVLEETDTVLLLHAVHGFDGGPRFAVGGSLNAAPPWVGVILQHPGA